MTTQKNQWIVWAIVAAVVAGIALALGQRNSGYSYLPGETATAQAVLAANTAINQSDAASRQGFAQLAVTYQTHKDDAQTSLSLASIASKTDEELARIQAGSQLSLAQIYEDLTLRTTRLNDATAQQINAAQLAAGQSIASTQKQGAVQVSFWQFLGNLASGAAALFGKH
jgi:hypothetical protein